MVLGKYYIKPMIKFHWMNKKLYITTNQKIKPSDLYLDRLVHPSLISYPLIMWDYSNKEKTVIQSHSGTTSPVVSSRRVLLVVG
jgi:hypothetical protein